MNTPERFWSQVELAPGPPHMPELGPCWEWTGNRYSMHSYGRCNIAGTQMGAHRGAWTLTFGAIPAGLLACHHCDNKLCVRPTHLFLGTHQDNQADFNRKAKLLFPDRPAWWRTRRRQAA